MLKSLLFVSLLVAAALASSPAEPEPEVPLATLHVSEGTQTASLIAGAGEAGIHTFFVANEAKVDADALLSVVCTALESSANNDTRNLALESFSIAGENDTSVVFVGATSEIKTTIAAATTKEFVVEFQAGPSTLEGDEISCVFTAASSNADFRGSETATRSTAVERLVYLQLFTTFDIVDDVFEAGLRVVNNGPSDASGVEVEGSYYFVTEGNTLLGTRPAVANDGSSIPDYTFDVIEAGSESSYVALFDTSSCNGADAEFYWTLFDTNEEQDPRTDQFVFGRPAFNDEPVDIAVSVEAVNPGGEGPFIAGSGNDNINYVATVRNVNKLYCATNVYVNLKYAFESQGFSVREMVLESGDNPYGTFFGWFSDETDRELSAFAFMPVLLPGSTFKLTAAATADVSATPGADVASFTIALDSSDQGDDIVENNAATSVISLVGVPNVVFHSFTEKSALAGGSLAAAQGPPPAKKRNIGEARNLPFDYKTVVISEDGILDVADERAKKLLSATPVASFPIFPNDGLLVQEILVQNVESPANNYVLSAKDLQLKIDTQFPAKTGRLRSYVVAFYSEGSSLEFVNGEDLDLDIILKHPTLSAGQFAGVLLEWYVYADVYECERCFRTEAHATAGLTYPYQGIALRETDDDSVALVASFRRESGVRLTHEVKNLREHGREREIIIKAHNAGPSDINALAYRQSITIPSNAKIVDMFTHHGVLQGHVRGSRHNLDERLWVSQLAAGADAELHIQTRNEKKNPGKLTLAAHIDTEKTKETIKGNEAALRFDVEL